MIGLIKKDVLLMQSYLKNLLLITAIFSGLSLINENYSFLAVSLPCMFSILCFTLISYDDYYHWDAYSLTLPIDSKDSVRSKYIVSTCLLAFGTILGTALSFAVITVKDLSVPGKEVFLTAFAGFFTASVLMSLMYPIAYRFGTDKGRFVIFGIFAGISIFIVLLGKTLMNTTLRLQSIADFFTGSGKYLLIPLILIIISVSYCISCKIFTRKEY